MKRLKYIVLTLLISVSSFSAVAQGNFKFTHSKTSDKLNFEFINNLVIIPVTLNGVELSFLLDTGVKNTILFSLQERDSLKLNAIESVKLKGLGNDGLIDAFKSYNNSLKIGNAIDTNHKVYVVLDQDVNFSTRLGKVIHGIIGYQFYKDFIVETDYGKNQMVSYYPDAYNFKRCRRCTSLSLEFNNSKPYINAEVLIDGQSVSTTLMVDSGSSDGLWLFDHTSDQIQKPKDSFEDYLGLGLNGEIFGERSRVKSLVIDKYTLKNVTTAFPDSLTIKKATKFKKRNGSIGTEVLRRFKVVIDYPHKRILLKRNRNFSDDFNYDMSGISLGYDGFTIVENAEKTNVSELDKRAALVSSGQSSLAFSNNKQLEIVKYELNPQLIITSIRKNSPAEIANLKKGDIILEVNSRPFHQWNLQELTNLFSSKENKIVKIKILRAGLELSKRIILKRRL